MDGAGPLGEQAVGCGACLACRPGRLPGVEGGPLDLDEFAQSLHLEGGGVVGDELEATHQFVAPAKYFVARCKISRSVASLVRRSPGVFPALIPKAPID
jgi:hypothetical protein